MIPVQAVRPIQPQPQLTNSKVTVEFTDDSNPDHSTGLMSPEVSTSHITHYSIFIYEIYKCVHLYCIINALISTQLVQNATLPNNIHTRHAH